MALIKTPEIKLQQPFHRNLVINGNFDFWQRGTNLLTIPNDGNRHYLADRFCFGSKAYSLGSISYNMERDLLDFHSCKLSVNAGGNYSSDPTGAHFFETTIESLDVVPFKGHYLTLSFKVKSSTPGQYGIQLMTTNNGASNSESYVTYFTINSANVYEKKNIVFKFNPATVADLVGEIGLRVRWILGAGASISKTTKETWVSTIGFADDINLPNDSSFTQTNLAASGGNYIQFKEIMVTLSSSDLEFRTAGSNAAEEFELCQRYYNKSYLLDDAVPTNTFMGIRGLAIQTVSVTGSSADWHVITPFPTRMRVAPTIATFDDQGNGSTSSPRCIWNSNPNTPLIIEWVSELSFSARVTAANTVEIIFHYAADAEYY